MDIKYIMPLLTPCAVDCPSSLSKTARHIAHCEFAIIDATKNRKQKTNIVLILCIIR